MQMINVEEIPGGDLKKRKTVRTILINESTSNNQVKLSYTLYDENKKIVVKGDVENVPVLFATEHRLLLVLEKIVHPTV